MESVTVALVGDPSNPWEGMQGGAIRGDGERYSTLPKIELDVARDERLLDLLSRAAESFSVSSVGDRTFTPSWVTFYQPEDEEAYTARRETSVVELVDELGRAKWGVWIGDPEITLGALLDSHKAGALEGDPHRPYLILRPGYGNGILPNWAEYLLILYAIREVLATLADAHGATQALKGAAGWAGRLLKRFRRTPEITAEHSTRWEANGGFPESVDGFLDRQPWSTDVLSPLLGCSEEDAEALLTGRGFTYNQETRLWHPEGDATGRIIKSIRRATYSFEWEIDVKSDEGRARLKRYVNEQLREVYLSSAEEE